MPLVPENYRCAVALGLDVDGPREAAQRDCLHALLDACEETGLRLELFAPVGLPDDCHEDLGRLRANGHSVSLLLEADAPAVDGEGEQLRDYLAAAQEGFRAAGLGDLPGVRVAEMRRNGLHGQEAAQAAIQAAGFRFVSSDYATKNPDNPRNIGFADKNAAMTMKHQQPRKYACGLWEIPATGYSDRAFFEGQARGLEEWIAHLQACVDFAHDMGGLIYAPHLRLSALAQHDPGGRTLRELPAHAGAKKWGDVATVTYREVWEWAGNG